MLEINKHEEDAVKKVFELSNRGFNDKEIACILNDKSVISGIACRIDSLLDRLVDFDLKIDEDIDYKKILQSKDKDTIDNYIVNKFNELKNNLNDENSDLLEDIEFILNETVKIYSNETEVIPETVKTGNSNIPFGYNKKV